MEILATLTMGTILLVLVLILLQFFFVILSLFISGKIVDSINDEFSSAMRTFGWWFLVGIGFSLLFALVGFLLEPFATIVIPILLVILIVVNFIIVKKIYDLGIGKTFLMFILFIVFNTIFTAVNFFLSTLIIGFSIFGMISGASFLSTLPFYTPPAVIVEEVEDVVGMDEFGLLVDEPEVTGDDMVGEEPEVLLEENQAEAVDETEVKKPKFPASPTNSEEVIEEDIVEDIVEPEVQ